MSKSICSYCKNENPKNANYCTRCGRSLHNHGNLINLDKAQFCYECGTRRERYTNDRRVCSILFADVHGYTAMTEKMDIEDVTTVMNECFSLLTRRIIEVGGSIDKYAGDNIMARFGAPEALEDHAERAVRAAIGMQEELARFSLKLQKTRGVALEMRIGINTGWVNAAEVGGEVQGVSYRTYTVMGDTVNTASRLEHEARIGKILVGEETYKLSKHAFDFLDTGERAIRGKRELVKAYEVIGPRPQRANRRGVAGIDLQLVGREGELDLLWERMQRAAEGQGQVVSVIGEAGVGKSSLFRGFKLRVTANMPDVRHINGAAFSYSAAQPFSLVRNAIYKLAGITDADNEDVAREKLLAQIGSLMGEANTQEDGEYGELAALLGKVVGINLPNALIDHLEPELLGRLLTDAVSDFLLKKAESNPLLLVLDDLHWADTSSLEVIDAMVRKVTSPSQSTPVLLLLMHRHDFSRSWPVPADRYRSIDLQRLNPEQVQRLTRQVLELSAGLTPTPLGETNLQPLPTALVRLVERANGNPFFAEEILKALIDGKQIERDPEQPGGWRVTGDLASYTLPETLQEILLARMDRLALRDKRVLQVASVVGLKFEQRLLSAVNDLSQTGVQVDQAISTLHNEDFVYTERQEPEPEYAFRHSLTREVAYNNLLSAERRQYHEQIAHAIESYRADRLLDYSVLDDLAYHYEHSDNDQKAIQYLTQAGLLRKSLYRNDEALKAFLEARDRLLRHPDVKSGVEPVQLNENIGDIFQLKAEYTEALTAYRQALNSTSDAETRLDIWAKIIRALVPLGEFDQALEAYTQAEDEFRLQALNPTSTLVQLRARLLLQVGFVYYRKGQVRDALDTFTKGQQLLDILPTDTDNLTQDRADVYFSAGVASSELGQFDEAESSLQEAIRLHQRTNNLRMVSRSYINLAAVYISRSKLMEAERFLKLARQNAEKIGDIAAVAFIIGNLGEVAQRQGSLQVALRYFNEAATIFERNSDPAQLANALLNVGRVLLHQGDIQPALETFDRGLKLADSIGATFFVAEGSNYIGYAYMLGNQFEEAEDWLGRGYAKAVESNTPEVLANNQLFQAQLAIERGSYDEAATNLQAARSLIEELGDPLLLGQLFRQEGRLAMARGEFDQAEQAFAASLKQLEPLRAYLEMSYTKLYWSQLIMHKLEAGDVDAATEAQEVETGQQFLTQASLTFEACEAHIAYDEANKLLARFEQPTVAA